MSEHVGMDLKGYLCLDAGALDKLLQARHGERRAALANEDERWVGPPLKRPQCPQFITE
jgi:hypothetical protein